jgi:hypothetical protein
MFYDWCSQTKAKHGSKSDCVRISEFFRAFTDARGLLDPALRHNADRLGAGGELLMRWLALLFQVITPGPIGFYLAYAMALGLPATSSRNEIPLIIILGGAVVGVLTWISGLISDRLSLTGLVLTIAMSMLGLLVSYLLIEAVLLAPLWAPRSWAALEQLAVPLILIDAALVVPLAGAMAGYYLPSRRPRAQGR